MKINLYTSVYGQYLPEIDCGIEVPALYGQCFEPIDICDDNFMAYVSGNGTLSMPFASLLDDEVIDSAIALHPNNSFALNTLKKLAPRMKELLGAGK